MSGIIDQIQKRTGNPDERLRVLDVTGEETDDVLDALASDTRRSLFRTLYEEPGTPSEIARRVDTSVQNVHYHLTNLQAAGLVEAIDTCYSEKGNEMTVYGPANDPIVFVGNHELRPHVHRSLADVVAGLAILGMASLLVQWGARRLAGTGARATDVVGPASRDVTPSAPGDTIAWLVFDVAEPGVLFFFGCLVIIAVVASVWER